MMFSKNRVWRKHYIYRTNNNWVDRMFSIKQFRVLKLDWMWPTCSLARFDEVVISLAVPLTLFISCWGVVVGACLLWAGWSFSTSVLFSCFVSSLLMFPALLHCFSRQSCPAHLSDSLLTQVRLNSELKGRTGMNGANGHLIGTARTLAG